jgi:hypothetical protein
MNGSYRNYPVYGNHEMYGVNANHVNLNDMQDYKHIPNKPTNIYNI